MALTKVTSGLTDLDGGITIDNITIDGTEIDLSSGDLTLDVAGDIILDADGGDWSFNDGGVTIGSLANVSSDFRIRSHVSDKDILFVGNDGGSSVTALTLDMSDAGSAYFNNKVGIGATSAGAKLDVNVNSSTAYSTTGESREDIIIHNTNGSDGSGVNNHSTLGFHVADGATSQGFISYVRTADNLGTFTFSQRTGSSSYAEAMRINSDGKLLIGTTSSDTSDVLQIESPASGGGFGIQIRRNDNNTDQQIGQIKFGNVVDSDIGQIHVKTDGATNTGAMIFSTANSGTTSERIRIAGNGAEVIFKGTSSTQLTMMDSSGNADGYVYADGGTTSGKIGFLDADGHWAFKIDTDTDTRMFVNNSTRFILNSSGNLSITGTLTENYSDDRLKENKVNIPNATDKVKSLNGFTYTPNATAQALGYSADKALGVSAQEVEAVLPEAVCLADAVNADNDTDYKTVQYVKLVPLLIEATKEQQTIIEDLKARIETLEG